MKALVNLSIVFSPRNPNTKPLDFLRSVYGEDYYMVRFQVRKTLAKSSRFSASQILHAYLSNYSGTWTSRESFREIRSGIGAQKVIRQPFICSDSTLRFGGLDRPADSSAFLADRGGSPLFCRQVRENGVHRGIELLQISKQVRGGCCCVPVFIRV